MNMKKILFPTLDVIKRNLFAPSDALVAQWVEQPETLTPETRQDLEASELAQQEKQSYLESMAFAQAQTINFEPVIDALDKVPDHIKKLINRQCDAAKHSFSQLPTSGLMVLINEAIGPQGSLQLDMATPMVVLLNKPTENDLVWTGWMLASETDYASCWDMVLDAEQDAPLDPLVGMVQIWNAVKIYLPSIEKAIGELSASRLELVRTLANEYLYSDTEIEETLASEAGMLHLRKINSRYLLTGTPLSGEDDPRWYYQELYYEAAHVIREPALLAATIEPEPISLHERLLAYSKNLLEGFLVPISPVSYAMGNKRNKKDWVIDKQYRISIDDKNDEGDLVHEILIKLEKPLEGAAIFEYREDGILEAHHTFSNADPEVSFTCDPQENYTFRIINETTGEDIFNLANNTP